MTAHCVLGAILTLMLTRSMTAAEENDTVQVKFATPCQTPNLENGLCVEIQQCEVFIRQIIDGNSDTYPFIKASSCGPSNQNTSIPKVCCGRHGNFISTPATTKHAASSTAIPPRAGIPNNPLPRVCGKQDTTINNRIFGGVEAELGDFPWLARLRHKNKFNYTGHGCAGLVIHRWFVLTAAHCLVNRPINALGELHGVVLGAHNDQDERECVEMDGETICSDQPRYVEVESYTVHEKYEENQHFHDIALVKLKEKISFTNYIKAICLPFDSLNSTEFWISGWGSTENGTSSAKKLKVTLPRVDRSVCSQKYKQVRMEILDTQLCAGGVKGKDSCAGDSGGPLMAVTPDNTWYAEGIVSYGAGCGRDGWPGVYTNVPKYMEWITSTINSQLRVRTRRNH